ncbi:hypothetical protein [Micrococcoides hystricis]|uniref:MFS transporter n=1 Tax=Micrococcoides hystricis TaxID=1572761 RepID=A0ABV6PD22_9MICC
MSEQHQVPLDPLSEPIETEMTVRRAPRIWPFLITGALLGVLVAVLVVTIGGTAENYTTGGSIGYFSVIFGIIGVGLAGVAFIIADRRSLKKATTATAQAVEAEPAKVEE